MKTWWWLTFKIEVSRGGWQYYLFCEGREICFFLFYHFILKFYFCDLYIAVALIFFLHFLNFCCFNLFFCIFWIFMICSWCHVEIVSRMRNIISGSAPLCRSLTIGGIMLVFWCTGSINLASAYLECMR